LADLTHIDRTDLHPERRRRGLNDGKLAGSGAYSVVPKDGHSRHAWRDLFEQFQPFSANAVFEFQKTGSVAPRPRQAVDQTATDWITRDREHDRHGTGNLLQPLHRPGSMSQDN